MKTAHVIFYGLIMVMLLPGIALCEEGEEEKTLSGNISIAGKYDTNVDLASADVPEDSFEDDEIEDAFIAEVAGMFSLKPHWSSPWQLEIELYGLGDLYVESRSLNDSWVIGRGNIYLGYSFGANTISLLNEAQYYSEPDDTELDSFRNSASLVYKRIFSPLWQVRIGYENIAHIFPDSEFFNYFVNGGFVEIRNTWIPAFSTYYGYDFQYYLGSYNSSTSDPLSSPEAGYRHTGEIGFESFFARKNSLLGAYTFQTDDSSGQGVEQIGRFRGNRDENLEVDAEFNFIKHKGMLLYSHKFNDRFTLSHYDELIYKSFLERDDLISSYDVERSDVLFLTSTWLTARISGELYSKVRYLYRMNESTIDLEDFQDHIFLIGLEYRF